MKHLKVILVCDSGYPTLGTHSSLVDADTGEPIDCVQDFTVNVPLDGLLTVDARLNISEVEVRPLPLKTQEAEE